MGGRSRLRRNRFIRYYDCQCHGANVVAVDLGEEKLSFARTIGAVATVDAGTSRDVARKIGRSPVGELMFP